MTDPVWTPEQLAAGQRPNPNGDGTTQFPPGGGVNNNPSMPLAPATFGVGAKVQKIGVTGADPMVVTRVTGSLVWCIWTDDDGEQSEKPFPPDQLVLVQAAPLPPDATS